MANEPKFIVVIGASAGGLNALSELVAQIDENIDAAFFVVLHLSKKGIGTFLSDRLQKFTNLKCKVGADGDIIERGTIYIAPPDYHMMLKENKVRINSGAQENRWRPSIDILFRSAAANYCDRVIGIVLTGLLDDGTSGMIGIQKCKGTTIVQDPNEAEYPDMPLSVLSNIEVDYCMPLSQIGYIIFDTVQHKKIEGHPVPPELQIEAEIAEKALVGLEYVSKLGEHSVYACPDCGGGLWHIKEKSFDRFKCHVGHSFSQEDLLKKQSDALESTMWVALRMMEERRNLLAKIANDEGKRGLKTISREHSERADDLRKHIEILKGVLFQTKEN
jgi:two-component system chemotaxis response regulator CheB